MNIQIEKNVPMPETRGRNAKYPLADMEVGDSFAVTPAPKGIRGSMCVLAKRLGIKVSVRTEGDGVRVWRTA